MGRKRRRTWQQIIKRKMGGPVGRKCCANDKYTDISEGKEWTCVHTLAEPLQYNNMIRRDPGAIKQAAALQRSKSTKWEMVRNKEVWQERCTYVGEELPWEWEWPEQIPR